MKDLQIVIVSWNVRDLLERCLMSLPAACDGLDWECIVVDNNSSDGSAAMVRETFKHEERIDLIFNNINLGFSRACNQGAIQHNSRNILLLNPDTECPAGSLFKLVKIMDERPDVGIMGPKILNPDGTIQPSVRRFPGLCDQAATMLKLQRVLPGLKCFKRYLFTDLETDRSQEVDQVMGACFLVRAECWDKLQGLDQRYFFWFEEVDACKQAKKLGWKVWYEPTVSVTHHRGMAVDKAAAVRKQLYFNDSLRKYMLKWHGWLAWALIAVLSPIATFLAAVIGAGRRAITKHEKGWSLNSFFKSMRLACYALHRWTVLWLMVSLCLSLLSAMTLANQTASFILLIAIATVLAVVTFWRPALGLSFVLLELGIGGFGHMAAIDVGLMTLSLRMVIMGAFFLGWAVNAFWSKVWRYWRWSELVVIHVWVFVAGMVVLGTLRGLRLNQPFILQDANGWFFLLYFIPVLDVAHRFGIELKRLARGVILASVIWNGLLALATLYIFTHGFDVASAWYSWIRDARIGEITPAPGGLVRVFFQSFIYSIFAIFGVVAIWICQSKRENVESMARGIPKKFLDRPSLTVRGLVPGVGVLSVATVALSLSRSYWVGLGVGLLIIFVLAAVKNKNVSWHSIKRTVAVFVGGLSLIAAVMILPPYKTAWSLKEYFAARGTVTDAAAASRWSLLPVMLQDIKDNPVVGHGLGRTLTYKSSDPRILSEHPDGMQTTYAFEWGWLSLWIKFGLFGVFIMGWLLIYIARRMWMSEYEWWFRAAAVASIAALAVIHFFTPYLDHPLGFAWLLGMEAALAIKRPNTLWNPHK